MKTLANSRGLLRRNHRRFGRALERITIEAISAAAKPHARTIEMGRLWLEAERYDRACEIIRKQPDPSKWPVPEHLYVAEAMRFYFSRRAKRRND